jgi:ATP-dependent DNA helicase RecG
MIRYPQKESTTVEWKREVPTKQQVVKTIVGFCNMHGGTLVIGVDDQGVVVGIDEERISELMEELERSIYASCSPPVLPTLSVQRLEDKLVLLIEVSGGMIKPYFVSSLGKEEGTFIRVGTQTVKATPIMLQELQWRSMGRYLDEMPIYSATLEELDLKAFEDFLRDRRTHVNQSDAAELLYHYEIMTKEHGRSYPTMGGLLLFGKDPQRFLSESFVICTHFSGTSGRNVVATRDCVGPLLQQYKDCMAFIVSRLNKKFHIVGGGKRNEFLEIPQEAVREIVINALIHRNYLIPGPTKIAIYDDRLEIFSPGNFPGPIKVDHLSLGVSYVRNKIIARVFREMGLVEKLGSGFLTLFTSYEENNLPVPAVVEGTGFVKCVLPRPGITPQPIMEKSLLHLFYKKSEVTIPDAMKFLEASRATASRELKQLVDQGFVTKIGKGPSTRYIKR